MKTLKLLLVFVLTSTLFTSCIIEDNGIIDDRITLEELVTSYDLWYVDYNKTTGNGEVPFLSKAFTISFQNGRLYANNNLVGIGTVGNGYGLQIGFYDTINGVLEVNHSKDGFIDLRVEQVSRDQIRIIDTRNGVTYYLDGYQKVNFDYDTIFYDNIEYFLQEYAAWEKSYASQQGQVNAFDNENFLEFTPEGNESVFKSSKDKTGINIADIQWDFIGNYKVYNVNGKENLKILTLDYDGPDNEEFELSVINDGKIKLYHSKSGTTYEFTGLGNIQYKKGSTKQKVRHTKRFKTNRETKNITTKV